MTAPSHWPQNISQLLHPTTSQISIRKIVAISYLPNQYINLKLIMHAFCNIYIYITIYL